MSAAEMYVNIPCAIDVLDRHVQSHMELGVPVLTCFGELEDLP